MNRCTLLETKTKTADTALQRLVYLHVAYQQSVKERSRGSDSRLIFAPGLSRRPDAEILASLPMTVPHPNSSR